MTYHASLDKTTKVITVATIAVIIICQIIPVIIETSGQSFRLEIISVPLLIMILAAVFLFVCNGFAPKSYTLTQDALIINRGIKPPAFRVDDIVSVELLQSTALRSAIKTFAVGGLFGYFGKYWTANTVT